MAFRNFAVLGAHLFTTCISITILYVAFPNFAFYYTSLANCILFLFFASFTYRLSKRCLCGGKIHPRNKAVLITGCDTGFGNGLAKRLDAKGFHVFAACLFPEGLGATDLKNTCSKKLRVLYLNVTKDESVEKAVNFVKENLGTSKLWALVNNAGIYKGFGIEFTSTDAFREVMEVNSIGPVRVTKAALPLLKESKGRVINLVSIVGRRALLGTCAYSMSKYAAAAFNECLSQELNGWGISVISIEPEMFRTYLIDSTVASRAMEEDFKKLNEGILSSYSEEYLKKVTKSMDQFTKFSSSKIHLVVDDIESAIMDKYPEYVYKPRWSTITRILWYLSEIVPYGIVEFFILFVAGLLGFPLGKTVK